MCKTGAAHFLIEQNVPWLFLGDSWQNRPWTGQQLPKINNLLFWQVWSLIEEAPDLQVIHFSNQKRIKTVIIYINVNWGAVCDFFELLQQTRMMCEVKIACLVHREERLYCVSARRQRCTISSSGRQPGKFTTPSRRSKIFKQALQETEVRSEVF